MSKRSIPTRIYKILLANSGNKCAFPACPHPIFDTNHTFIAELCHIEAVSSGGQRFNPALTQEEINGYGNLLFLCKKHHKETDDVNVYTVEVLKKIKQNHESQYIISPYTIDMSHVFRLKREIETFWEKVQGFSGALNLENNINTKAEYIELTEQVSTYLNLIEDVLLKTKRDNDEWDILNISVSSHISSIKALLEHMNIKYHEEKLNVNPQDVVLREYLEKLRESFLKAVQKEVNS